MINGFSIALIIPALNEQASISQVLKDVPLQVDQIVVVDNGSTDDTAIIAKKLGATVVYEQHRGYGAACQTGIQAVGNSDIVAFMDADYSDYPQDLLKVLYPICLGQAEFVIGSRLVSDQRKPVLTRMQRAGNKLVCNIMASLIGFRYTDLGPMRAILGRRLQQLAMSDTDYGWTIEMQIKAVLYGLKTQEVPVNYRQRIGESKISGTLKGSLLAGMKILSWTFRIRTIRTN